MFSDMHKAAMAGVKTFGAAVFFAGSTTGATVLLHKYNEQCRRMHQLDKDAAKLLKKSDYSGFVPERKILTPTEVSISLYLSQLLALMSLCNDMCRKEALSVPGLQGQLIDSVLKSMIKQPLYWIGILSFMQLLNEVGERFYLDKHALTATLLMDLKKLKALENDALRRPEVQTLMRDIMTELSRNNKLPEACAELK